MSRERSFAWLPCLFYRLWSTLGLWRRLLRGWWEVCVGHQQERWGMVPASSACVMSVTQICQWYQSSMLRSWNVPAALPGGSKSSLVPARRRRVQPGLGGIKRLLCPVQAVCSTAWTPGHATAEPDFMGLWLSKENVHVSGWQPLQDCCVLPGGKVLTMLFVLPRLHGCKRGTNRRVSLNKILMRRWNSLCRK